MYSHQFWSPLRTTDEANVSFSLIVHSSGFCPGGSLCSVTVKKNARQLGYLKGKFWPSEITELNKAKKRVLLGLSMEAAMLFLCHLVPVLLGADYMASFSPGWNFVAITWLVSARAEIWNYGEKWETAILFRWTHNHWARSNSLFSPGWNFNAITWGFSEFQPGLKIPSRFHKPGWKSQPGLKFSPCNRKRLFKKICSGGRGKISARLTGLKFQPGLKFAM